MQIYSDTVLFKFSNHKRNIPWFTPNTGNYHIRVTQYSENET